MTRRCAPACCRSPYCAVRKIGGSPPGTAQSGGEPDEGRRPAPLGRVPTPQAWVRGEQCSHYSALRSTGGLESPQNVFLESCFGTNIPHSGAAGNRNCAQRPGCAAGRWLPPGHHTRHGDLSRLPSSALPRASVSPYPRFLVCCPLPSAVSPCLPVPSSPYLHSAGGSACPFRIPQSALSAPFLRTIAAHGSRLSALTPGDAAESHWSRNRPSGWVGVS
jgi:hypothetical protein